MESLCIWEIPSLKGSLLRASALQWDVEARNPNLYLYMPRVIAHHCIRADAWAGTARCSPNKLNSGLWSARSVKWRPNR